jgi:hypothetical protein
MTRNEMIQVVDRLDREGGFAKAIGQALLLADDNNKAKILRTFPEIFYKLRVEERVRLACSVPTRIS